MNNLLRELEDVLPKRAPTDEAYTTEELAQDTGKSRAWIRTALKEAVRAGTWESIRVPRKTISGSMQFVPAYRPKVRATAKKKSVTPKRKRRKRA